MSRITNKKLKVINVAGREPKVTNGKFCSTSRGTPGQCVYLERSIWCCNLYNDNVDKLNGKYIRSYWCRD